MIRIFAEIALCLFFEYLHAMFFALAFVLLCLDRKEIAIMSAFCGAVEYARVKLTK